MQAAAYQISLDRTVGEHRLPENCIVIAAGNRVTDKSVAYAMPKALANRLCHFEIKGDPTSWHDWAVKTGVHEFVVGYLEYNPTMLMRFDSSVMSLAFPTPRSWEMVSNILNSISPDIEKIYPMIVGCIGDAAADSFKTWTELYKSMPPVERIFAGEQAELPKAAELQIVLRSVMVAYARRHPEKTLIDNSVDFACRMPWSFRGKLLHDYKHIPEVRPILETNEVFQTALRSGSR